MTWPWSGFYIGRSPAEASQIKVLVRGGLAPGVRILCVKLSVLSSCIDMEFQRRPQRPGLHSHCGKELMLLLKRGGKRGQLAMFCCPLPEGGATGAASPRKPESEPESPLGTWCCPWGLWERADFKMTLNSMLRRAQVKSNLLWPKSSSKT